MKKITLTKSPIFFLFLMAYSILPLNAANLLKQSMNFYIRKRYKAALEKAEKQLEKNSKDELASGLKSMIGKTVASVHLKKAFTLLSEGLDTMGGKELDEALKHHSEYTMMIEEKYSGYLEKYSKEDAANRILFEILKHPEPTQIEVYKISRRVRERIAGSLSKKELMNLEKLKVRIAKLQDKKKWDKAVVLLTDFLANNPDSVDAKLLLSRVNRLAAADFYEQAILYLDRAKIKEARSSVLKSKGYDPDYFEVRINSEMQEVKMNIVFGETEKARSKLEIIKNLEPENPKPALFLDMLDEPRTEFFKKSINLYKNKDYQEAAIRLDFMILEEPDNKKVRLFYHLSLARQFIKENNLDKVKEHLIRALEISPDEKEAIETYDRLEDVLDVMEKT